MLLYIIILFVLYKIFPESFQFVRLKVKVACNDLKRKIEQETSKWEVDNKSQLCKDSSSEKPNISSKKQSKKKEEKKEEKKIFNPDDYKLIGDNYESYTQVLTAMKEKGVESVRLIFAIDFTASNRHKGIQSFGGLSLHSISPVDNPYQKVLRMMFKMIAPFDNTGELLCLGFGDTVCRDKEVFNLLSPGHPISSENDQMARCESGDQALKAYESCVKAVKMDGPTSFSPVIECARKECLRTGGYHILVIVTDGQTMTEDMDSQAIARVSREVPLSIICVGVGDGPFDTVDEFDDDPNRKFDNLQSVNFTEIDKISDQTAKEKCFALHALMEIPLQYEYLRRSGRLTKTKTY